jgi:hypothetical protein
MMSNARQDPPCRASRIGGHFWLFDGTETFCTACGMHRMIVYQTSVDGRRYPVFKYLPAPQTVEVKFS